MKLQVKPNRWSCAITSWAMALDIEVGDAINFIGHDGGDVIFPELAEPRCRRGFHSQELVELAMQAGVYPTPFQVLPSISSECGEFSYTMYPYTTPRFEILYDLVESTRGVLEGKCATCHHAVAYDHGKVFDPDGREFPYSAVNCRDLGGFYGKQLWIFNR